MSLSTARTSSGPTTGFSRLGRSRCAGSALTRNSPVVPLQRDTLIGADCHAIWTEQSFGAVAAKPVLDDLRREAWKGDTLVAWALDRLAQPLHEILDCAAVLEARGIELRVLTQATSPVTLELRNGPVEDVSVTTKQPVGISCATS